MFPVKVVMSTRVEIDRVRVLLARVDEAEKALDAFDNVEVPNRRDVLIRRVDAARDELVDFVAKLEEAPSTPPPVTAMKSLRFALPDGQPVVFCPRTPPLATSEAVNRTSPRAPLESVARTSRCRAGCRQGDHSVRTGCAIVAWSRGTSPMHARVGRFVAGT